MFENTHIYIDQVSIRAHNDETEKDVDSEEQSAYLSICGQRNWIYTLSRADISYHVCQLSAKLNDATIFYNSAT